MAAAQCGSQPDLATIVDLLPGGGLPDTRTLPSGRQSDAPHSWWVSWPRHDADEECPEANTVLTYPTRKFREEVPLSAAVAWVVDDSPSRAHPRIAQVRRPTSSPTASFRVRGSGSQPAAVVAGAALAGSTVRSSTRAEPGCVPPFSGGGACRTSRSPRRGMPGSVLQAPSAGACREGGEAGGGVAGGCWTVGDGRRAASGRPLGWYRWLRSRPPGGAFGWRRCRLRRYRRVLQLGRWRQRWQPRQLRQRRQRPLWWGFSPAPSSTAGAGHKV